MTVEQFSFREHWYDLLTCLQLRNAYIPIVDTTPAIGYVAYKEDTPVAYGFLRQVEGGYGMVDGLVTNPRELDRKVRHEGLDLVFSHCQKEAIKLNIHSLIGFSVNTSTIERSEANGYAKLPHVVMGLNLNRKAQ